MVVTETALRRTAADTVVEPENVVFDLLEKDQWRVLDGQIDRNDIAALLGFVEIVAGVYEVTFLSDPGRACFCASLDDVRSEMAGDFFLDDHDQVTADTVSGGGR